MSILFLMVAAAVAATVQESLEQRRERVRWARRRVRRYTFN